MSPHGIAGSQNQSSPNLDNKCPIARPLYNTPSTRCNRLSNRLSNRLYTIGCPTAVVSCKRGTTLPNFGSPTRSVRDIRCRKFLLPEKQAKVHQNPLRPATHHCPSLCQISSRSAKRCRAYEKSITIFFTPFTILAPQGDIMGQSSPISKFRPMYSKARTTNVSNFASF